MVSVDIFTRKIHKRSTATWKMLNIIRKMQVKTTVRYHIIVVKAAIKKAQQITNAGKEKKKTLGDGNANQCGHYGRAWLFPKH